MKKFILLFILGALFINKPLQSREIERYFGINYIDSDLKLDGLNKDFYKNKDNSLSFSVGVRKNFINHFFIGFNTDLNLTSLLNKQKYIYKDENDPTKYQLSETTIAQFINMNGVFGYRIDEKMSIFGTLGAKINFFDLEYTVNDSSYYLKYIIQDTNVGLLFGIGISYKITRNFECLLSYEMSKFKINAESNKIMGSSIAVKTDMDINNLKFGINYIF